MDNIIQLFHNNKPSTVEIKEIRNSEADSRWIIFIAINDEKYVIKIASNGFTTKERVNGWVQIVEEYKKLGYYSPNLQKSINGNYCEEIEYSGKSCVVWEEEFAKYSTQDTIDKSVYGLPNGKFVYYYEVLEFLGKVASLKLNNFSYCSGYARLKPFSNDEVTDEITQCIQTFDNLIREKTPEFTLRWQKILKLFEDNKKKLSEIYDSLPTSVFQSDTIGNNLLLDANGHFKGVIDYNLAGYDTNINMFISTVFYGYCYSKTDNEIINDLLDALKYIGKYYSFNKLEIEALPHLYKYIFTIEYRRINALKKALGDTNKVKEILDSIERTLTNNIDFKSSIYIKERH